MNRRHRLSGVVLALVPIALVVSGPAAVATRGTALTPVARQAADPIRIHVFATERPAGGTVEVDLPPSERKQEPIGVRAYRFDMRQAGRAVRALRRALARGKRRRRLIMVVDRPEQADVLVEVVATQLARSFTASSSANRPIPLGAGGGASRAATDGSRLSQSRHERALVVRLSVRNHVFTTDLLGRPHGILKSPAYEIALKLDRWVTVNYHSLLQIVYGLP